MLEGKDFEAGQRVPLFAINPDGDIFTFTGWAVQEYFVRNDARTHQKVREFVSGGWERIGEPLQTSKNLLNSEVEVVAICVPVL